MPTHDTVDLATYAERAYLEYAMSVVKGRALPDIKDGQKPVQRRILYAMRGLGLGPSAKPVKSARVVGEILGKYHPHGDSSAYEAMVRMAQNFVMRYPLVDGHGNFGSRDGDGSASMRYTECRLTKYADLVLSELESDTVDYVPNYDGVFKEPVSLPSRLPMLLLNGASGIAVGLSTDIPPHNLTEIGQACIMLLQTPSASLEDLMTLVKGPDFPCGGQCITAEEDIKAIYSTGKGSVRVRAKWTIEKLNRGQWRVVITELPPAASSQKILAEIEEASNPKIKQGKKTLTQDQYNLKSLMLSVLDTVRDESDYANPVRLVLEPKSSRMDPDEFMQILLANTSLESNTSVNMVMIDNTGRPRQMGLKEALLEWLDYRYLVFKRRLTHQRDELVKRIHILEGRLIAFVGIDKVIRIIRNADDPKDELIRKLHLSAIQADDILEIRLRQLARLEGIKLENDLDRLRKEAGEVSSLLNSPRRLTSKLIKEIDADIRTYGDARRTEIKPAERISTTRSVADEPVTLIMSASGWVKLRHGHRLDLTGMVFKGNDPVKTVIETRSVSPVVLMDTKGRAYTIDPADIPVGRHDGVHVSVLVDIQPGAKPLNILTGTDTTHYLLLSNDGYGFIVQYGELLSRQRAGKAVMTVPDSAVMLEPVVLPKLHSDTVVTVVTTENRVLSFFINELKVMAKGRGLQTIGLRDKATVTVGGVSRLSHVTVSLKGPRGGIATAAVSFKPYLGDRGRTGRPWTGQGTIIGISAT